MTVGILYTSIKLNFYRQYIGVAMGRKEKTHMCIVYFNFTIFGGPNRVIKK